MVPHRCILAAKTGDLQTLKDLDASGDLNEDIEDSLGATPVHHAARAGKLDCLKFLIGEAKLPGNKKAKNGATPAHDAAATGNLVGLQWLTSVGGCNIQEHDDSGASVLHLAARFGRSEIVQWLVKEGCDPMVETNSGAMPAHYAAAKGDLTSLKLLIVQAPGTLNKQTRSGATPLYLACQEGHLHVVEYLVKECGAFLDLRAHDGMTALHAAAQMGHYTVMAWLASLTDMDLSAQDNEGASAMHFAASAGHARILEQLITMRAKTLKDHWGGTPLHDAAENGELECCQILVMNQVDPTTRDKDGYTARELANYNGHMECANYLRRMENMDHSPSLLKEDSFRRSKSIVRRQSGGDYYRSFNEGRRESLNFPQEMENGRDTILVKPEASIYPQPPTLPSSQPIPQLIKSQPLGGTTASHSYHCNSNVKSFNMVHPTDSSSEHIVELKSATTLKTAGFTTMFVGNSGQLKQTFEEDEKENGFLPLPVEEVSSIDIDSLVPTHDERGRPIPEWKRQVMVRKLQARLQVEEEERRNHEGNGYLQMEGWRYSQVHNAILGPYGELLTEDDLIYLEKQIETVQVKKKCQEYESELTRLAEELRTILPAPIVNITVNTQFFHQNAGKDGHTSLPVWCNRISGIVRSMSLLLSNLNEKDHENKEIKNMPNLELVSVFSPRPEKTSLKLTRNKVEKEIQHYGVSVRNLRANFEKQCPTKEKSMSPLHTLESQNCTVEIHNMMCYSMDSNDTVHPAKDQTSEGAILGSNAVTAKPESWQEDTSETQQSVVNKVQLPDFPQLEEMESTRSSGTNEKESAADPHPSGTEATSLRKERIVVLFLGHWKKSTYTMSLKMKVREIRKTVNVGSSSEDLKVTECNKIEKNKEKTEPELDNESQAKQSIENGKLRHLFLQRRTINKLIGNWRNIISHVPSRQIRRLHRQQITYSPEQFLPRVNGIPLDYDSLTLDLFMLGYFHILELDLPPDERKMRHLLCFEVFDHLGAFSWDVVRAFHKSVIDEIDGGNREWKNGFEDIKQRFFSNPENMVATTDSPKQPVVTVRPVPKVIVQSATPEEYEERTGHDSSCDLSNFSNDEICKYIDRSFAFWKDKEAEIFDFEE